VTLPAEGTRGGIIIVAVSSIMRLSNLVITSHTLSAIVHDSRCSIPWEITGVYGPQGDLEKMIFLREVRQLQQGTNQAWLLLGDFNLICRVQDKSNNRINRTMISIFQRVINHLQVRELNLLGRRFTWTNNQNPPTMTRIDKAFCTSAWDDLYANPTLQSLSSSTSDHCPLLPTPFLSPRTKPIFRFESFWVSLPEFNEVVTEAWNKETPQSINGMLSLHVKLCMVATTLNNWSKSLMSHANPSVGGGTGRQVSLCQGTKPCQHLEA
jgi:hypothetical protein